DRNRSHWSTSKTPSYTKSVSWQHHPQGADGIQNRLTAQDIAEATIIIHSVAVTPEDNERFESRDVYEITLQDAIKNAAGIIKEIEEMIASEQQ
ncbi:hypothetical protein OU641_08950, partial [Escherichia coli]|nr:hypothetical protein [Escherichia coli]